MKQKMTKKSMLLYAGAAAMLFLVSCTQKFEGDTVWSSSVKDAQLESPAIEDISVKFTATGEQVISWPVIMGAGGYQVTFWNVDDPENPVVIGEQNQIVDGLSVKRPAAEDSRFMFTIKTLGNAEFNNTEATTATEIRYTNLLPVTAVIPNGTDLATFFTEKTIEQWYQENPVDELCFELEANGSYTMSGNVRQGIRNVTFRGDKVNHPTLKMTDGSFVNSGAGFKLRFMDINYADFEGSASNAIVLMDEEFNAAGMPLAPAYGHLVIPTSNPIMLDGLNIKGLKYYVFYDNSKLYAVGTMLVRNCVIGQNTSSFGQALFRFNTGTVKDFTMTTSTLYNEAATSNGSNRFMQISSSRLANAINPPMETWAGGSMTITNNTFYRAGYGNNAQSFNSNNPMGGATDRVTVQRNVFVDCYENGRIISRFRRGNTTAIFSGGQNTQWYNGARFTGTQDVAADVAYFETDPQLEYLGNGVFRMSGAEQIAAKTGDPRWLPGN